MDPSISKPDVANVCNIPKNVETVSKCVTPSSVLHPNPDKNIETCSCSLSCLCNTETLADKVSEPVCVNNLIPSEPC